MYLVMSEGQGVVTSAVPCGSAERSSEHTLAKSVVQVANRILNENVARPPR